MRFPTVSRHLLAYIGVALLIGCAEPEPPLQDLSPSELLDLAAELEAELKRDIGVRFGDSLILKGVSRRDARIKINLEIIDEEAVELTKNSPGFVENAVGNIAYNEICGERPIAGVINAGLVLIVGLSSPDGRELVAVTVDRC